MRINCDDCSRQSCGIPIVSRLWPRMDLAKELRTCIRSLRLPVRANYIHYFALAMASSDNVPDQLSGLALMFTWKARFTDLPDELLLPIFKFAAGTEPFWTYNTASPSREAYNLCLVCKKFLPVAQEVLYTNVVIPSGDNLDSPRWTNFFNNMLATTRCRKLTLKCSFMTARAEDRSERISLNVPTDQLNYDPFDYVLKRLPHLECLEDDTQWRDIQSSERSMRTLQPHRFMRDTTIQYTTVTAFITDHFRPEEFQIMVSALPAVKRLLVKGRMRIKDAVCLADQAGRGRMEELHVAWLEGTADGMRRLLAWPKTLRVASFALILATGIGTSGLWHEACGLPALIDALRPQQACLEYLKLSCVGYLRESGPFSGRFSLASFAALHTLYIMFDETFRFIDTTGSDITAPKLRRILVGCYISEGSAQRQPDRRAVAACMRVIATSRNIPLSSITGAAEPSAQASGTDAESPALTYALLQGRFLEVLATKGLEFKVLEMKDVHDLWMILRDSFRMAPEV